MMLAVVAAMAHLLTEGNLLQLKDQPKVHCCLALIKSLTFGMIDLDMTMTVKWVGGLVVMVTIDLMAALWHAIKVRLLFRRQEFHFASDFLINWKHFNQTCFVYFPLQTGREVVDAMVMHLIVEILKG